MTQLALSFTDRRSIDVRFAEFHAANEWVYSALRGMALTAKREGHRVGIRCLWETFRWTHRQRIDSEETFRCNDHFPSRFARLLMEREPELAGFFETRGLRA